MTNTQADSEVVETILQDLRLNSPAAIRKRSAIARAGTLAAEIIHEGVDGPSATVKLNSLGDILAAENLSLADLGMTTGIADGRQNGDHVGG